MKKILAFCVLCTWCVPIFTHAKIEFAPACEYKSDFDTCVAAQTPGNTRAIKDFVCVADRNEYVILGQIILDKKFKQIDQEVEEYIFKLEEEKDYYF